MNPQSASRSRLSRRSVLGVVPAAVGLVAVGGIRSVFGRSESPPDGDPPPPPPPQGPPPPTLKPPPFTSNGAKGPGTVEMSPPMDPTHYVPSVSAANERD